MIPYGIDRPNTKPNVSFIISKKLLENSLFIMSYSLFFIEQSSFYNTPETIIIKKAAFLTDMIDYVPISPNNIIYAIRNHFSTFQSNKKQNLLFYILKVVSESILLNQYIYSLLKIKTEKNTLMCKDKENKKM